MKTDTLVALACISWLTLPSFAQTGASTIPEDARKHFIMGATLFKGAKSTADFGEAEREFKQATRLASQWPDARYNLALAKEAAGDYSGAMADLKVYQQFKLSESDARTVQDKIYALEAKAGAVAKRQAGQDQIAAAAKNKKGQTREVLVRLKAIVGNAAYDRVAASAQDIYKYGSSIGVNDKEYNGNNWYSCGSSCEHYVFEENRVLICFQGDLGGSIDPNHPDLIGTPNGSKMGDIVWEVPESNGPAKKRRVWAKFNEENGSITWSGDRPISQADFNPNVRYNYWLYRRH